MANTLKRELQLSRAKKGEDFSKSGRKSPGLAVEFFVDREPRHSNMRAVGIELNLN
jgi:hypothetical protein